MGHCIVKRMEEKQPAKELSSKRGRYVNLGSQSSEVRALLEQEHDDGRKRDYR